jgi:hypothetical protein
LKRDKNADSSDALFVKFRFRYEPFRSTHGKVELSFSDNFIQQVFQIHLIPPSWAGVAWCKDEVWQTRVSDIFGYRRIPSECTSSDPAAGGLPVLLHQHESEEEIYYDEGWNQDSSGSLAAAISHVVVRC